MPKRISAICLGLLAIVVGAVFGHVGVLMGSASVQWESIGIISLGLGFAMVGVLDIFETYV